MRPPGGGGYHQEGTNEKVVDVVEFKVVPRLFFVLMESDIRSRRE
jgi:hypothetical protein